jgi:hypothetical protein
VLNTSIQLILNYISHSLSGNQFYHGMVTEGNEYALIFISPGILPGVFYRKIIKEWMAVDWIFGFF